MDYNVLPNEFNLDIENIENKINALCITQSSNREWIIKNGILTSIAFETLPNYKNYKSILSGITQARMIKGVNSKRNFIESSLNKILQLYDIEEINKDILETAVNLVISTFDTVFENSTEKTKKNYEKILNDVEFLYINLKLAVKIVAETLRRKDIELSNMSLQYITDAIKKEKKNIAETYMEAYLSGDEESIVNARNNYRNKMELMLNEYYTKISYNHEHAVKIGLEKHILDVLGKNFLDVIISILLYDISDTIKRKHQLQLGFNFTEIIK